MAYNYLEIDKRKTNLEQLQKDIDLFNKKIKSLDGENECYITPISMEEEYEYYSVVLDFDYRDLFEVRGYLDDKITVNINFKGKYDSSLEKFNYMVLDWAEISTYIFDVFSKYFR